jgi:hypothetical protein
LGHASASFHDRPKGVRISKQNSYNLGFGKVVADARGCNLWRVPTKTGPTQADAKLIADLATRGLDATPAQFKRWRAKGLLCPPERLGAGRGKGRPSLRYPPHAVEQAVAIIKLRGYRVPLGEMAIAMFLDHVPVSEAAIRKSIQTILADPESEKLDVEARADLADSQMERVLRTTRRIPFLQFWSKRSRQAGNRETFGRIVAAILQAASVEHFPTSDTVEETGTVRSSHR